MWRGVASATCCVFVYFDGRRRCGSGKAEVVVDGARERRRGSLRFYCLQILQGSSNGGQLILEDSVPGYILDESHTSWVNCGKESDEAVPSQSIHQQSRVN